MNNQELAAWIELQKLVNRLNKAKFAIGNGLVDNDIVLAVASTVNGKIKAHEFKEAMTLENLGKAKSWLLDLYKKAMPVTPTAADFED